MQQNDQAGTASTTDVEDNEDITSREEKKEEDEGCKYKTCWRFVCMKQNKD